MEICPYQSNDELAWDRFVHAQPGGTLFHLTAWKRVIEKAFGFAPRYLLAQEHGEICGVLPLFSASNWIQGRTLISTPFAVYGGICAEDERARQALGKAACRMAVEEGVEYLELRERQVPLGNGFHTKQLYVAFQTELPKDPDQLMRSLPKDTRYMIRKGQKNGLRANWGNEQIDVFYEIYAHSVRHLGTPVFARSFFQLLAKEFAPAVETVVIWQGQKAMAGALCFRHRGAILPYYGGSLVEARQVAANNFLYWEILRSACAQGLRSFDFGRSKLGTGSYFFKTQWNMRELPLPYQFYLVKRATMPNFSPVNPRFKPVIAVWKHIPLALTKALGPVLVRLFP